jgi:hypothetical protein
MVPLFEEVKRIQASSSDEWKSIDKSNNVQIEVKKSQRGMDMFRAWGTVDWPVIDVYRCMSYFPTRSEWEPNTEFAEHLKKVGPNAFISYSKSKKHFMIYSRDFLVNYLCNREEDGTIRDVVTSENVEYDLPEKEETVRAWSQLAGTILTPDPQDLNKTVVFMCAEVDLKGLPSAISKIALKDNGQRINNLRKLLPKWKQMFPGEQPS